MLLGPRYYTHCVPFTFVCKYLAYAINPVPIIVDTPAHSSVTSRALGSKKRLTAKANGRVKSVVGSYEQCAGDRVTRQSGKPDADE